MGTKWAEVICGNAMVYLTDPHLREKLEANPAAFLREMACYLQNAVPLCSRPPELEGWLRGTPPAFADFLWETGGGPGPAEAETGRTGFELCCVTRKDTDRYGNPCDVPCGGYAYDAKTGRVSFPEGVEAGRYDMDFYTDGEFALDLTPSVRMLLGQAVNLVYEFRFSGDWLARTPKATDKTFNMPNEANWTNAQEAKRQGLERSFQSALRGYEQAVAYRRAAAGESGML